MFTNASDRFSKLVLLLFILIFFGATTSIFAQDVAQVEPDAGTWQTWVLESGDQFRPAAPPDEAATAGEIAQLQELAGQRDDAALMQIAYWNAGPPAYRWNQIAVNALNARGGPLSSRNMALLHAAIYDATVAAWDSKYAYNRPRPSEVDPSLTTAIPNPSTPAYVSEYAATAGAASSILSWLFPDQSEAFDSLAQEAINSRLLAGVEYPSDVEAGLALGRQVAELVIERGMADGTNLTYDPATMPTGDCLWTGENPITPMAGSWETWVLATGDQLRPPPPPACDSEQIAAEMQELRDFERTPVTNALSLFWEYGAGGRRNFWLFNDIASRLILEAGMEDNAPLAARVYALMNIAAHDAYVACWDAKYAYWYIRPFQLDPEFSSQFATPNHPSYPSAHSCISNAEAGVLAHLFPVNATEVLDLAHEASESRIWSGIHYRTDVVEGIAIGEAVADLVIEHAENDGSQ